MFDYNPNITKTNRAGALEVAMRARDMEKKQALQVAEFKMEAGFEQRRSRGLISSLLSGLRTFLF
jgi:hypothetical protein